MPRKPKPTPGPYRIIYADPPWKYRDKAKSGNRGAGFKYRTMSMAELLAMRPEIDSYAAEDCVLFLWATLPMLPEAFTLLKGWGFKFRTVGFVWVKTTTGWLPRLQKAIRAAIAAAAVFPVLRRVGLVALVEAIPNAIAAAGLYVVSVAFGGGNWTRTNAEVVIIASRGRNPRASASVSQIVFAPQPEHHSEKPDEVRRRILELLGDLPRIELFCRHAPEGWATHGDEVGRLVPRPPPTFEPAE